MLDGQTDSRGVMELLDNSSVFNNELPIPLNTAGFQAEKYCHTSKKLYQIPLNTAGFQAIKYCYSLSLSACVGAGWGSYFGWASSLIKSMNCLSVAHDLSLVDGCVYSIWCKLFYSCITHENEMNYEDVGEI